MKKLYKGFLFTLALSFFAANLLTAAESTISLPDVKTVVTGDNPEQKAVGPDFSDDVSTPSPDGTLVPDVPESRKINLMGNPADKGDFDFFKDYSKTGIIGGAFPFAVTGNIKIQKKADGEISEKEGESSLLKPVPFFFDFAYDSLVFSKNDDDDDLFFRRQAELCACIPFYTSAEGLWAIDGTFSFYDYENSLQGRGGNALSVNQRNIFLNLSWKKEFTNKLLEVKADADFYSRTALTYATVEDFVKEGTEIYIRPDVLFTLDFSKGDTALSSIVFKLSNIFDQNPYNSPYKISFDTQANFAFGKSLVNVDFGLSWAMNLEHSIFVIAPLVASYSYGTMEDPFYIRVKTGVESYLPTIYELEKKYRFAVVNESLKDTSDLVANVFAHYKVFDELYLTNEVDFKRTFYNHGLWVPDYNGSVYDGIYTFTQVSRTALSLSVGLDWMYNYMKIWGNYKINFLDKEPLEGAHCYQAGVSFFNSLSKDNRWMITLNAEGSIGAEDNVPLLGASFEKRFNNAIALEISGQDLLKFITNNYRNYAGGYVQDSGKVALVLKLNL